MLQLRIVLAALSLGLAGLALAQPAVPPPQNVVSLSASASTEVTMDRLSVTFGTTREGAEAAGVQAQLRQALEGALDEARKAARPGELEVRTGGFALHPRYAPPNPRNSGSGLPGGIVGWQGSTELIVEGRDTEAIARLTGRIRTLNITRVGWSLSREARERVESELAAQAIDRFRARADAVARQFGFAGWTLREASVSTSDAPPGVQLPLMRAQALRAAGDETLPVEAGKAQVSAGVSGSVQLTK